MSLPSFKSFLSHRYKSAAANLYFHRLFTEVAEVQFEVDEGTLTTNVTRLERMLRDADAFIGIYPFEQPADPAEKMEALKKQSKYFRLELDLAIRANKPAIIFYDRRYGNLLDPPENVFCHEFDANEITGSGGFPSYGRHKKEFMKFCEAVQCSKNYADVHNGKRKSVVGLFVDPSPALKIDYTGVIAAVTAKYGYTEVQLIPLPVKLNLDFYRLLEKIDFAIVECNGHAAADGVLAFLHARFIPAIRMRYTGSAAAIPDNNLAFLFDGVEVGYRKDILDWSDEESLSRELSTKLEIINWPVKRINTADDAKLYFSGAVLRKEVVFVSYSGKDADTAKDLIHCLKQHFHSVFDYRDGSSIIPGRPWLEEIFETLAKSAIGISLLSDAYLQSANCKHEALEMMARHDNNGIQLFPIKLYPGDLTLPSFMASTQYFRKYDYNSDMDLINEIARLSLS